jgi:hypothetical protein
MKSKVERGCSTPDLCQLSTYKKAEDFMPSFSKKYFNTLSAPYMQASYPGLNSLKFSIS